MCATTQPPQEDASGTRPGETGPRILLIDDSRVVLNLISKQLKERGFDVVTRASGFEGLDAFFSAKYEAGNGFDIVVTDIVMPDFSGISVLNNIKQSAAEVPVIMLTSEAETTTVLKAVRDGAFDYVIKDEGVEPLVGAISRAWEELLSHRAAFARVEDAFTLLHNHASSRSRGELIVQGDSLEVHVFFLDGSVVWATSSQAKHAFSRFLVERHGIDPAGITQVVELCRRTGGNIGETLIASKVATLEQVRDSLRSQIREALATLHDIASSHSVFLTRNTQYSTDLCFQLEDVMPRSGTTPQG
ncbi:response regulator [Myxococcota bacterium]